jgi:hypothetical protein
LLTFGVVFPSGKEWSFKTGARGSICPIFPLGCDSYYFKKKYNKKSIKWQQTRNAAEILMRAFA